MAVRELGFAVILTSTVFALGSGSSLSGQSRPETLERPSSFRKSSFEHAGLGQGDLDLDTFAAAVLRWNGDIFWAPATASKNTITRFGDEARSVFGPIPHADCAASEATVVPVQVDGNIVDLRPNTKKAGHPLEFEHKDAAAVVQRRG